MIALCFVVFVGKRASDDGFDQCPAGRSLAQPEAEYAKAAK
jgi:hypothetical protein